MPTYEPRASNCPDLTTEDNRTPIVEGMRLFNYYDGEWGIVEFRDGPVGCRTIDDGWFNFRHDDGTHTLLNGVRVATFNPKEIDCKQCVDCGEEFIARKESDRRCKHCQVVKDFG